MDTKDSRILVVDDDCGVLRSYLRTLHEYAPLHADDGVEACAILSAVQVDVVVCDLQMPRMNGLDLMRWAKKHCPHPLWIVVSGQGTFEGVAQALKLGAFDFICKPIQSPLQLQTVVANALGRQALVAERALLVSSLADNTLRLAQSHEKLEAANAVLREQQAMLDQDLQRAERILQALLPHELGPLERMQINVAHRPSKSIGGDLYGAVMLDDRHLAVYVADAAGHGVSAALLAVLFHQRLSTVDARRQTPAMLLRDLNRGLFEECRASGLFVTVVYALIDTVARTATIASAGHPPGLVLRGTGISRRLEKTGPALGLLPDATYGEHRIALADGDRLLLYTDGLIGAMGERAASLDSILAAVASDAEDGARVVEQLKTWSEPGEDDMTVLLLTANSGVSTVDADQAMTCRTDPGDCPLSVGSANGTTWVVVRGQATWKDARALRDTCVEAFDKGQDVVVDLAFCTMLDSTVLGTLHELVERREARPPLWLQSASEEIRVLFAELAMTRVLSAIAPRARPAPRAMIALHGKSDATAHGVVLHAHELLAELSASNSKQFQPVIDALRGNLDGEVTRVS
jgi:sigma-B regulation protein RsbU (phosphoserine phosphatase)